MSHQDDKIAERNDESYKTEIALRFLESLSNSRILTDLAMKNLQNGVISAMALITKRIGNHAVEDFAKTTNDQKLERKRQLTEPNNDEDLFA